MSKSMQLKQLHMAIVFAMLLSLIAPVAGAQPVFAQASEAAPVLLSTTPANGEVWDGGPVVFTFDKTMSAAEILVSPSLEGATAVQGNEAVFTPAAAPDANTRYQFTLASATAEDGTQLTASQQVSLQASGPLSVAATQPSDGSEDTDPTANITVIFNRPVVPLTGVAEQGSLPQPLSIDPPVAGQGQWISTSVYQFTPDVALAGATQYQVTVAALTDVAGDVMAAPYTFSFSTAAPIVTGATPAGIFVNPDAAIRVTFSQPMDPASTEAAFSLAPTSPAGESVEGTATWNITNTTLIFTPTAPLEYGAEYTVQVADTAQPASEQGNLREAFASTFTVVPLPQVYSSSILDGAEAVNPETELRIRFSAPVSETTLLNNIQITPLVTSTTVVSFTYSDFYENTNQNQTSIGSDIPPGYNTHLMVNWYREPNTTYTVTIGTGVVDQFGNPLPEPYTVSFTTGDYSPLIQIDLDRFTHYSTFTTTVVGVKYRNMDVVDAELFQLPLSELYVLGGENQWQVWDTYQIPNREENLIWSKSVPAEGPRNVVNKMGFKLVDGDGNPLPPGVYMLEVRNPLDMAQAATQSAGPAVLRAVIVLSSNNITLKRGSQGESLAWVTDLADGRPVEGAAISFTKNGTELAQGTTDADGLARAALNLGADEQYAPVFAASGQPGDPDFAVVSSDWDTGIEPWSFNFTTTGTSSPAVFYIYTERPIYQPGQTVYWKGIVRLLQGDEWALPAAGESFQIRINDTLGNVLLDRAYTTDEYGTIHGDFALAPDAPTGWYGINSQIMEGESAVAYGSASFVVAAYRKPEFQIDVKSDQPEYVQGDTITVTVQASYFSGGPLVEAPVEWRLTASTYTFNWADAPKDRFYSFEPFDPDAADYDPYQNAYLGLVQEGKGTTDAEGRFTIAVPADLGASLASQTWSMDVVVTSPTSQQVFNNVTFPVHRGDYYIGLSPASYVAQAGQDAQVDVVTVTPQGEMYPNADLDVVVYEFRWNSVYEQAEDGNYYWKSTADRTPVYTTTVSHGRRGCWLVCLHARQGRPVPGHRYRHRRGRQRDSQRPLCVGGRLRLCGLAAREQRPHRIGGGSEAVCPRRHGQDPGAQSLHRHGRGTRHPGARRRHGCTCHAADRQQPDHRRAHYSRYDPERLCRRGAGQGRRRNQPVCGHARRLCRPVRGHEREGTGTRYPSVGGHGGARRHRHVHVGDPRQRRQPCTGCFDQRGIGGQGRAGDGRGLRGYPLVDRHLLLRAAAGRHHRIADRHQQGPHQCPTGRGRQGWWRRWRRRWTRGARGLPRHGLLACRLRQR